MRSKFKFYLSAAMLTASSAFSNPCDWEVTAGLLFLQPSAGNLGWGVVTDFSSVSPQWHIETIKPAYHAAYNLGVRYAIPCSGSDIKLDWDHLCCRDNQAVVVTPFLQWISPFAQTGPGTGYPDYDPTGVGQLTQASCFVKFLYDVVNLDVGTYVDFGPRVHTRLFCGLSGTRIKQELKTSFQSSDGVPLIGIDNTSSYVGVGPRFGFEYLFDLCRNFDFVGKIGAGLLFGSIHPAQYQFSGSSEELELLGIAVNNQQISSENVYQTVPFLDAKLGLRYSHAYCGCLLNIEAGYMGAFYNQPLSGYEPGTNVLSLEDGSLSINSMKHIQTDFSAQGPYLVVGVEF